MCVCVCVCVCERERERSRKSFLIFFKRLAFTARCETRKNGPEMGRDDDCYVYFHTDGYCNNFTDKGY